MSYKNIDFAVRLVMNDLNDFSMHNYARLLQLGFNGHRELNLFSMPQIKVVHATLNEINCWNFPPDFLFYTKVAICIGGRLYTLTKNDDICLHRHEECGIETLEDLVADTDCGCYNYGYYYAPHYYGSAWYGSLYGMGGGLNNAGYYRVDHEMRRIQFDSIIPQTELVIEYKSTGLEQDGSAVVPQGYVAALQEYIHWKNVEYSPRVTQGEKQRRFAMYDMEYNKAMMLTNSFTIDEYFDSQYSVLHAGVIR